MRHLTAYERMVLQEAGDPGEGPVPDETFAWAVDQGYGYWGPAPELLWCVTEKGRYALLLDDAVREMRAAAP